MTREEAEELVIKITDYVQRTCQLKGAVDLILEAVGKERKDAYQLGQYAGAEANRQFWSNPKVQWDDAGRAGTKGPVSD